ncbi:MAG: HEAT repeat domain-containing protein [Isosphaeraceae bacterium]
MKAPAGWRVTLFASPPQVNYPTCLAASMDGLVFVGVDENGSLDAKAGRGRVVRCADRDGDGRADEFKTFAAMDSPRGLVWHAATSTLYVLHPPRLTAFVDDDHDGVADRSDVLVEGIGFDLKFRGADHTTNGIRLGVDGYLYVAVGDYGFIRAVGKDGRPLQFRGGGVARVRTDGTGLEIVSRGQRNIYDVAVDPFLNLFTRDNTNDGGGWDVRLSHVIPSGQYGYPSLFTNFGDEIIPPLADYGGGSPCGSLYLQEPGFPEGFGDTLYTCEWGRSGVYRHPLTRSGAGFKAGQELFVSIPRPTDMDVDAAGRVYVSSWREGMYTFSGPNVGHVVRLTPPGAPHAFPPDPKRLGPETLVSLLESPSAVVRLAGQREILARDAQARPDLTRKVDALVKANRPLPLECRVAALATLAQLQDGSKSLAGLLKGGQRQDIEEFVLRFESERRVDPGKISPAPFLAGLKSADPRVRLMAVVALGRLGKVQTAPELVKRTADSDPLVAHAAVRALSAVSAVEACLAALDPKTPELARGAAKALQAMHTARTVDGLIEKLAAAKDDALRKPILSALCRLDRREEEWKGGWWGTRPDTSGPYYTPVAWDQTDKIRQTLRSALGSSDPATARWLLGELVRNKVELDGLTARAMVLARADRSFRQSAVGLLASRPNLDPEALAFLTEVAGGVGEPAALRVQAIRGLLRRVDQNSARDALVAALAPVGAVEAPEAELLGAWQDFVRDARVARQVDHFAGLAEGADPDRSALAYAVLLQAESNANPRRSGQAQEKARAAVEKGAAKPELTPRLIRAVGLARDPHPRHLAVVREHLRDRAPVTRLEAIQAAKRLGLERPAPSGPTLAGVAFETARAAVLKEKGDPAEGARLFQRQGCVNCHTVVKAEPVKGPYLGDIANRYSRAELTESILQPSAKIAQGFETQKFATTGGQTVEGFVVRESGDEVEIRTSTGAVTVLPKSEIEERGKNAVSVMPNGLADTLTAGELASILAYLESLRVAGAASK